MEARAEVIDFQNFFAGISKDDFAFSGKNMLGRIKQCDSLSEGACLLITQPNLIILRVIISRKNNFFRLVSDGNILFISIDRNGGFLAITQ